MSLRMRLIVSYTLIVILCLSIAAIAVSAMLQSYRDRFAMARLEDMTRPIYVQVRSLALGEASITEVMTNLQEQAQRNNVYILLVDDKGNIARQASPKVGGGQQPIRLPPGELPHGISKPTQGTFETASGQTFIFAAYPIARLFEDRRQSRLETLVLSVPRGEAIATLAGLVRPFLQAGLIALVISVVVAVFLARSVYRPIRRVTESVEEMSQSHSAHEIP